MFKIVNNYEELFNTIIKINGENPIMIDFNCEYNTKSNINGKIPISNKYFLSVLSNESEEVNKFFSYITDETRSEYPFNKDSGIDYSMGIEIEQILNMDILNSSIKEVSYYLQEFLKISSESNGDIFFIIDIKFMVEFEIMMRQKSQPNHLIEMILWVLKNKIDGIILIDPHDFVGNNSNMLYVQLESCLKNYNPNKYRIGLENYILVYRDINDSVIETVYWNILFPGIKISKFIEKIKSPYDETNFDIVQINNKNCFLYKIKIFDCIEKNLLNLENEPGIIIEPIDRLKIFI